MGYKARDGRQFLNHQMGRAYDERLLAGKSDEKKEPTKMDVSEEPIEEVVKIHGPAHKIEIKHDHEEDTHKVVSHHGGEKHPVVHESEHGSVEEAHKHAKKAASGHEEEESPSFEAGEQEGRKEYSSGIPGL